MLKQKFYLGRFAILVAFIVILSGCSSLPLPPDRLDYAGRWESAEMLLTITKDGYVEYKRLGGGMTKSVNGPIKEYIGDDFVVGVLFIKTTFKVNKRPYQQDGRWKMIVDGVVLVKVTF